MKPKVSIFWFRRDLRLHDNAGLYHALSGDVPVIPLFIFDKNILDELEDVTDRRVEFIHQALQQIQEQLTSLGSTLEVHYGFPQQVFLKLLDDYDVQAVYTNNDYEPYAKERDDMIGEVLKKSGVTFSSYKDQVIFEKSEVVKSDEKPYTVFTPFSRSWKARFFENSIRPFATEKYFNSFISDQPYPYPN